MSTHTPTPWILSDDHHELLDASGELVATAYPMNDGTSAINNAHLIHRAVNNHEALVEAVKRLLPLATYAPDEMGSREQAEEAERHIEQARAVLQSASGSPEDAK